jgi:protein SCO1
MNKGNNLKIFVIFFAILILGFLTVYKYIMNNTLHNLPVNGQPGHRVGSFSFIDQDSNIVTEQDVKDKIYVTEFFFTTCKSICPIMNDNMLKVYEAFKNEKDFMILSHTVMPDVDTVAQMKRYSQKFDADPYKWKFLTGSKSEIYQKAINNYLLPAADSTQDNFIPDFLHSERFALVDKDGRIRGRFYDGTNDGDIKQLIGDIKLLIKEYKEVKK